MLTHKLCDRLEIVDMDLSGCVELDRRLLGAVVPFPCLEDEVGCVDHPVCELLGVAFVHDEGI